MSKKIFLLILFVFFLTKSEAQQLTSPISNASNYPGTNLEQIYAAVEDDLSGCITTAQFVLYTDPLLCATTPVQPPNLPLCESSLGSGSATFDFTLQTPIVLGTNISANYTVTYHLTQAAADGDTGAINPISAFLGTNGQTIYVRMEENASPLTYGTTSFQLIVNPLPVVVVSGPTAVCLNTTATITFTGTPNAVVTYNHDSSPNQTVTLNGSGTATVVSGPVLTSTTYNLVSIVNPATTCARTVTGSTTVGTTLPPTITTPSDYVVCDDSYNNDGFSCDFDLNTKINEITGGDSTIVVNFYETATSTTAIPLNVNYCSIVPGTQPLYVRAYTTGSPSCYATTTLNLIVKPLPLANPVISDYELCDDNNPGDAIETFTLNTKDTDIANGQLNVTISYYDSQPHATDQVTPLPNLHPNGSNPEQIWINISNDITGCSSVSSFNLIVNPLPPAVIPQTLFECSNGLTNQAAFDLTINEAVVTNGNASGLIITYYTSLIAAQNEDLIFQVAPLNYLGTDSETIYIRVEDNATGCYATTTQLLRVTQGPTAITPLALHYCDPNNDGFGVFNLNSTRAEIAGGTWPVTGVSITFHETQDDASIGAAPITDVTAYPNINLWTQTIYVRVYYTLTGCANYVQLQLIVDPTPEATVPNDYVQCDYTGAVGSESFDLTTTIPQVLGSLNPALNTVKFYTTLAEAQSGNFPITNLTNYINQIIWNPTLNAWIQTLYVRVETTLTGCYDIVALKLIVHPIPNSTQPNYPQYSLCDVNQSTPADIGFETFDLASQVAPILLGQTGMQVTFYPSLTAAQNGTGAITNLQYQNQIIYVQTLGIRITNVATGCYVISTMDIRVAPLPEPIPPTNSYTLCDDNQDGYSCDFDLTTLEADILQGAVYTLSFYETKTDAELGSPLPIKIDTTVPYCNINPFTQTLWVRAENPLTFCWNVMPIILNVTPSPIAPINLDAITVCDNDNNPYNFTTGIDLTQRTPDVVAQQPPLGSYDISYYTTQAAAEAGTSPIIPATNYVASTGATIWVRVEDNVTGCYNIGSFKIIINIPLQLTTPAPLSLCDDDATPNNQYHSFNLTIRDNAINQNTGYTVTYYPSLALAQAGGPTTITDFTAYTNSSPSVQTLGVVVTSAAGCQSITTLDIRVLPLPTPKDPSLATPAMIFPAQCETSTGSGVAQFDLTTNQGYIKNGDPNVTLHYFPSHTALENNTNEITTPTVALVGDPSIAGTTINLVQYVYIAVESTVFTGYNGRKCYKEVKQGFIVNPLPSVASIADYQICEADPSGVNDGKEQFDLTTQNSALLANNLTTPISSYSVMFYEDAALTLPINNPSAYLNTSSPQTIYVQITNTITGCESAVGQFNIVVNPKPLINYSMTDMKECDTDGVNNGTKLYTQSTTSPLPSLAGYVDAILGITQTAPTYIVEFYYNSQSDAQAGNSGNALTNLTTYEVQTGTYWVRVENTVTGCYQLDSFDVIIEKLAEPVISSTINSNIACVRWDTTTVTNGLVLDSGITAANYTYQWYADGIVIPAPAGTTVDYVVSDIPQSTTQITYTIKATSSMPPLLGCTSVVSPASTFTVIKSGPAGDISYNVSNAFENNQIITVTNSGYGLYEYSLDDGPRQTSPIFENVSLGSHTVYIWDVRDPNGYSCGVEQLTNVQAVDYPHYFTPNGDGIHDTWNIVGLGGQPNTKIYIFDRLGKLLKQISSTSAGWDGTFNGSPLPSDDYWFTVDYEETSLGKQFKSHFSLKR